MGGGIRRPLNGVEWSASAPAAVSQRKGSTLLGREEELPVWNGSAAVWSLYRLAVEESGTNVLK